MLFLTLNAATAFGLSSEDVPSDRQQSPATPRTSGPAAEFVLPPTVEPEPDAGSRSWATTDAETIIRDAHLRKTAAAFGAAGSFTGLGMTFYLVSLAQEEEGPRRGWRRATLLAGGAAGVALLSGTVLWATTPHAPGQPRFALGPEVGLTVAFSF